MNAFRVVVLQSDPGRVVGEAAFAKMLGALSDIDPNECVALCRRVTVAVHRSLFQNPDRRIKNKDTNYLKILAEQQSANLH